MCLWDDGGPVVDVRAVSGRRRPGSGSARSTRRPTQRRRGYASNLVAAASQRELDGGRRACFLFTDLANPTSNHIYEAIGYEPVRDFDQYRSADRARQPAPAQSGNASGPRSASSEASLPPSSGGSQE